MQHFGIEFILRLDCLSIFIVGAICFFTLLTAIYAQSFFKDRNKRNKFYIYLLFSFCFSSLAVLADNLVIMLFFWEGLLLALFGMISQLGNIRAFKTAIKAFVIIGISDLCLMLGIALTGSLSGTLIISKIHLVTGGLASTAFILLIIGAISKAGSMPFHSWIPDAAGDAPLPFMAFFPAALEKLLGIYFLVRICLGLFKLQVGSALSVLLMTIGAITIILAVMVALVQKDYKRLLSYHAISQVGYMILGIGTCLPVGIIGGIFHMINNALYKSCLFFTAGAVEKQTGTTNLEELGGLYRRMPVTFIAFFIAALSISGVPPFNGFFSKELIYDAALSRGKIFYLAAVGGSFFTAASFLKLGHSVFLGKLEDRNKQTKEAPRQMLVVMIIIAFCCILLGLFNGLALNKLFQPAAGVHLEERASLNLVLVVITVLVLVGAFLHHLFGVRISGSGLKAVDHIHDAPVLSTLYHWQEKKYFDPYELARRLMSIISKQLSRFDRLINWVYDSFLVKISYAISRGIRHIHAGYYVLYVIWSFVGAILIMFYILR